MADEDTTKKAVDSIHEAVESMRKQAESLSTTVEQAQAEALRLAEAGRLQADRFPPYNRSDEPVTMDRIRTEIRDATKEVKDRFHHVDLEFQKVQSQADINKGEIDHRFKLLEQEFKSTISFEMQKLANNMSEGFGVLKTDMAGVAKDLNTKVEKEISSHLRWTVAAIIAAAGLTLALSKVL